MPGRLQGHVSHTHTHTKINTYTHTDVNLGVCAFTCVCVHVCDVFKPKEIAEQKPVKVGQFSPPPSPALTSSSSSSSLSITLCPPVFPSLLPPLSSFLSSSPPHVNTMLLLSGSGMPEGQSRDRRPVTMTTASPSCLTPRLYWLRAVGGGGERGERER